MKVAIDVLLCHQCGAPLPDSACDISSCEYCGSWHRERKISRRVAECKVTTVKPISVPDPVRTLNVPEATSPPARLAPTERRYEPLDSVKIMAGAILHFIGFSVALMVMLQIFC